MRNKIKERNEGIFLGRPGRRSTNTDNAHMKLAMGGGGAGYHQNHSRHTWGRKEALLLSANQMSEEGEAARLFDAARPEPSSFMIYN